MSELEKLRKKEFDKELKMGDIEELLLQALFDSLIKCPYCNYTRLKPDYYQCPKCHKRNPLDKLGMI